MSSARISVALCTYNGSSHLSEQLQSLSAQTRKPDELVVFDDASTDQSGEILRRFAVDAPFPVRLYINAETLGVSRNFSQAIEACDGEIIALCDQDDVWLPEKLSLIEAAFVREPKLGFVFTDAKICDEQFRLLDYRLWDSVVFTNRLRRQVRQGRAFEATVRYNFVTGATMAFASRYRPLVLPIDSNWVHDGWIALLISAVAPVAAMEEPTILYRQHASQSIGAPPPRSLYQQFLNVKKLKRDVFLDEARMFQAAQDRLMSIGPAAGLAVDKAVLQLLREKIAHCLKRSAIRRGECGRVLPSLGEFLSFRYHRFSLGWKSLAQDLFL